MDKNLVEKAMASGYARALGVGALGFALTTALAPSAYANGVCVCSYTQSTATTTCTCSWYCGSTSLGLPSCDNTQVLLRDVRVIDDSGRVYVADFQIPRIVISASDGRQLAIIGWKGEGT